MGRMDHHEVGGYWDRNADTWIELSRAGYHLCRDLVNTPAFLALLPDVTGLTGLDVGCGEGHNTRLLARRGARMRAIDLRGGSWRRPWRRSGVSPLGVRYLRASAVGLPFRSEAFDFVVAVMSLMDVADLDVVVAEVHRVLRPGGFLQCSIEHPCAVTPPSGWVTDEHGRRVARAIGGYFDLEPHLDTWLFSAAPEEVRRGRRPFQIPRFPRTLSAWLNLIASAGLVIEAAGEPCADDAAIAQDPKLAATLFLLCAAARQGHERPGRHEQAEALAPRRHYTRPVTPQSWFLSRCR